MDNETQVEPQPEQTPTVWIEFHRDALHLLGTRTEEGLKLTVSIHSEVTVIYDGVGFTTARLDINVEDDGMRLVPTAVTKIIVPK